ncbi:DUF3179 domain-containing protein [Bauldia litoralis]|uniref:DUF3179 domain-containing protein n=1 Tax=Bauldia litoralis TaxID=665467 RepID=UPI003263722E
MRAVVLFIVFLLTSALAPLSAVAEEQREDVRQGFALFTGDEDARETALAYFGDLGPSSAAALILAMRFVRDDRFPDVLRDITGETAPQSWSDWMLWQEAHPEIEPFEGFDLLHARAHSQIDANFQLFLGAGKKHEIRIEEIVWGGVIKDGIPALNHPRLIAADAAGWLNDEDLVFGVSINGDARAYPLRILDWHEMFNDVIGGVPVALAYCTLCGSGILFETRIDRFERELVFGSSGFLYRSNKLMYDTETHSLWNQFTGRPVVGPLTGSGIELKTRPVVIARWADWRRDNPETRVIDIDTGFSRDYAPGAAYTSYFASPDLMFPTRVDQSDLKQKDYVFALRAAPVEKAWPLDLFAGGAVINDSAGVVDLVLIGDAASRTVRAYRSDGMTFEEGGNPAVVMQDGARWQVTEDALVGPDGRSLARLPGHIAYWFAWSGYFGGEGEVAGR